MTKSIKNGKAIYNLLDVDSNEFEIETSKDGKLWIYVKYKNILINQTTANELIKILKEFVETGDLK